eukprot:scaffold482_cov247-Pinguiococcus_pyrenoidosus.AAC.11
MDIRQLSLVVGNVCPGVPRRCGILARRPLHLEPRVDNCVQGGQVLSRKGQSKIEHCVHEWRFVVPHGLHRVAAEQGQDAPKL